MRSKMGRSRCRSASCATSLPLFCMAAASASVLPPAPAQMSAHFLPRLRARHQRCNSAKQHPALRTSPCHAQARPRHWHCGRGHRVRQCAPQAATMDLRQRQSATAPPAPAACRLQRVDAKINRRALGQCRTFAAALSPKERCNEAASHSGKSPATCGGMVGSSALRALALRLPSAAPAHASAARSAMACGSSPRHPAAAASTRARGLPLPMRAASELRLRSAS